MRPAAGSEVALCNLARAADQFRERASDGLVTMIAAKMDMKMATLVKRRKALVKDPMFENTTLRV
jgi:hypothetical protein